MENGCGAGTWSRGADGMGRGWDGGGTGGGLGGGYRTLSARKVELQVCPEIQ